MFLNNSLKFKACTNFPTQTVLFLLYKLEMQNRKLTLLHHFKIFIVQSFAFAVHNTNVVLINLSY